MRRTAGILGTALVVAAGAVFFTGSTAPTEAQTQYYTCGCLANGQGVCIDYLYTECSSNSQCKPCSPQ